jgi:hypothetical protein
MAAQKRAMWDDIGIEKLGEKLGQEKLGQACILGDLW